MSDSSPEAPDVSVLGKRVRNSEASQNGNGLQASNINTTVEDDSDDDDVGPMPMPAEAPVAKKKRRGMYSMHHLSAFFTHRPFQVLPHERLFLEHLPNTDQYYKSFMHRDTINFSVITRQDLSYSRNPITCDTISSFFS